MVSCSRFADPMDLVAGSFRVVRTLGPDAEGRLAFGEPRAAAARRTIPLGPSTVEALRRRPCWRLGRTRRSSPRLGHSTRPITLRVYSRVSATMRREAAAVLDRAIGG